MKEKAKREKKSLQKMTSEELLGLYNFCARNTAETPEQVFEIANEAAMFYKQEILRRMKAGNNGK